MKKYYVDNSKIHGLGIHAAKNLKKDEEIGHVVDAVTKKKKNHEYFTTKMSKQLGTFIERTELERYLNHSNKPNAVCIAKDYKVYLVTLKQIKEGEEVTVNYKDAYNTLDEAQIIANVENK